MEMLIGTEKQIAWANEIREYVVSEIEAGLSKCEIKEDNKNLQEIKKDMQNNQASFWINTFKFENQDRKGKLLFEYLNSKAVTGRKIAKALNEINGL